MKKSNQYQQFCIDKIKYFANTKVIPLIFAPAKNNKTLLKYPMDINEKNQVYIIQKQLENNEALTLELAETIEKLKKFEGKLNLWTFNVIMYLSAVVVTVAIIFLMVGFILASVNPDSAIIQHFFKQGDISCKKN